MTQPSAKRKAIDGNDLECRIRDAARAIVKTEPSDEDNNIHDSGHAYELRGPSGLHCALRSSVPAVLAPLANKQPPATSLGSFPLAHERHRSQENELSRTGRKYDRKIAIPRTTTTQHPVTSPLHQVAAGSTARQARTPTGASPSRLLAPVKLQAAQLQHDLPPSTQTPFSPTNAKKRDMNLAVYTFSVINASFNITEEELKTACTLAMGIKHVPSDESVVLALTTGITLRGVTFLPDPVQHEPPNIFLWRADEALAIEPTAVKRRIHEVFGLNTIIDVTYRRVEKEAGGILVLFAKFYRSLQLYSFFLRLLPDAQDTSRAVQAWFRPVRYCLPCEVCQAKHTPSTICEKTDAVPMT
ncbi:hypothetical protein LTR17_000097 [Elasticomyces elasticus]|nr:hypothetical protein LTR17_000097 [Elasticomyces elasticus]